MGIFVEVSNLGPLRSAEVELADLTLLIGENNTGKTFFATVLHRVLVAPRSEPWPKGRLIEREVPSDVLEWFERQLVGVADDPIPNDDIEWSTPDAVLAWATDYTRARLDAFGASIREGVEYAYGAEASELRRRTPSRRSRDCFLRVRSGEPSWEVEVRFDSDDVRVVPPDPDLWLQTIIDEESARYVSTTREQPRADRWPSRVRRFTSRWLWYWGSRDGLFREWPRFAVHLPANRTGFMQSYQVLAGAVVRQSASAGIRPIEIDPLPGTSADFLSLLLSDTEDQLSRRQDDPRFRGLIEDLEADLRAEIALEQRATAVDAVVAVTPEGEFPLSLVSSMLSELAPIILVLKGSLCRSDHITIDEPEAHLHPAMQRRVATFLGGVVSRGTGVLLTTHSDFFLGEINNLIRSGRLVDTRTARRGRERSSSDKPTVCALGFSRGESWCVGRLLAIDPVDGIDGSTFTDVMESLYDDSVQLINELL